MAAAPRSDAPWSGPGAPRRMDGAVAQLKRFVVGQLIPPKGQRVAPTKAGMALIGIALAIGLAAYNTSSNILFLTLSLLLASLILSGLLSWINFRRTAWRLIAAPPFRANQLVAVTVEARNGKRFLPTSSLVFEVRAEEANVTRRLRLRRRMEAGRQSRIDWSFRPARRGLERLSILSVGSKYPFGFLDKRLPGVSREEIRIWPERVAYRLEAAGWSLFPHGGEMLNRPGGSGDLINVRAYQAGDPQRQIHWKATARSGRLMVRQLAAENDPGFALAIDTPASRWRDPEQFEMLCRLVASLAEDLFREGRIRAAFINDLPVIRIRRLVDLELLLDQLAVLQPSADLKARPNRAGKNTITFEPGNARTVYATLGGEPAAAA
jgi:uncharacterized protein (DUF58 family)